jgi:hypothetical protein
MASAAFRLRADSRSPSRRFADLFRREVAPHVERLEAERERQRHSCLAVILATGGVAIGALVVIWPVNPTIGLVVALALGALGFGLQGYLRNQFSSELRKLVMPAICQAIGGLTHQVGGQAGIDLEELTDLGLLPSHNRRVIDDVFTGRHRDTGFTMIEARLRRRGSGRRRRTRTVFRGLILQIETPKPIPARILIARDSGALGNRLKGWLKQISGMQRIAVPHPAFEERFELYADRPDLALETVSPAFCDTMVALAEAHDDKPLQGAFAGRHFYIAMPRSGDQFRLGSVFRPLDDLEAEAGRVLHDVQIVHRVIDTLHGGQDRYSRSPVTGLPDHRLSAPARLGNR